MRSRLRVFDCSVPASLTHPRPALPCSARVPPAPPACTPAPPPLTHRRAPRSRTELGPAEFGEGVSLTDTAKEIGAQFGVRSLRVLADLSIAKDVDRIVEEIMAEYGRIASAQAPPPLALRSPGDFLRYCLCWQDILVHNAGGDIAADGGKADPNDAVMFVQTPPFLWYKSTTFGLFWTESG